MSGSITLIIGPMFSGKSTELQRILRRASKMKSVKKILCINHNRDNRYGTDHSITHDGYEYPAFIYTKLSEVNIEGIDMVGIDEGHFFEDLYYYVNKWSEEGVHVVVAGLHATFQRKPFTQMCELVSNADDVKWLTAICASCEAPAAHSFRISNEEDVMVVGSEDKYEALCSGCHREKTSRLNVLH